VASFTGENLNGSRFEDVHLTDARFRDVDLTNARFHLVDLTGAVIRGAALVNVDITGEIENVRVNGVDVVPLVEAELDRRSRTASRCAPPTPTVSAMRGTPSSRCGSRPWSGLAGWSRVCSTSGSTRSGPSSRRCAIVFATDAWVKRAILGEPSPWDPLDLPHDEMPDEPSVPRDRDARPSLDEVLALRADRTATVRHVLVDLTDEKLAGMTEPVIEPGYPEQESFAVRRCLQAILSEEWMHRLYAERDLEVLESRSL
jgi:DinB superfamily/Pentapeptide repeats (8 copies)